MLRPPRSVSFGDGSPGATVGVGCVFAVFGGLERVLVGIDAGIGGVTCIYPAAPAEDPAFSLCEIARQLQAASRQPGALSRHRRRPRRFEREVSTRIEKTKHAAGGTGKRLFDLAAATALLLLLSPLILVTALLIKIDSKGPILYRQQRIGLGGVPFEILKFRSMSNDAEKDGVAAWAVKNDCRVTRVGRFIRKLRIDEIPQAINVIRGDMSFVGPRPERPEFVHLLEREIPNYHLRHIVRPGITGWAQVKYEYGASVEDARIKMQYDMHYLEHFSLWRDFLILLMTVRVALFGIGSR